MYRIIAVKGNDVEVLIEYEVKEKKQAERQARTIVQGLDLCLFVMGTAHYAVYIK